MRIHERNRREGRRRREGRSHRSRRATDRANFPVDGGDAQDSIRRERRKSAENRRRGTRITLIRNPWDVCPRTNANFMPTTTERRSGESFDSRRIREGVGRMPADRLRHPAAHRRGAESRPLRVKQTKRHQEKAAWYLLLGGMELSRGRIKRRDCATLPGNPKYFRRTREIIPAECSERRQQRNLRKKNSRYLRA